MPYLLLIIGFVLLIKGADFFVDGASSLAKILKISPVIIGLTVVAIGTSLPEASVSINAAIEGKNDIAVSNIIGSNIFNLLVVIGFAALLKPFKTDLSILKRDMPINLGVTILLAVFLIDETLQRWQGILFLAMMIVYIALLVISSKKENHEPEEKIKTLKPIVCAVYIVLGGAAIVFGGTLTVDNAVRIAESLGMSESLIALTVIALGTSLPEFVTGIVAAKKGESGMALGDAVGSCIFNILFILGASSAIKPLSIAKDETAFVNIGMLILTSVLIYAFSAFKKKVDRPKAIVFVACYVLYMLWAILHNYGIM